MLALVATACSSAPVAEQASSPAVSPKAEEAAPARAPASPKNAMRIYSRHTCSKDKVTQILEIDSTEGKGCKFVYTVGKRRKVSKHLEQGRELCRQERDKILADIKARDFQCDEPSPLASQD
jgi:hypothetical protein